MLWNLDFDRTNNIIWVLGYFSAPKNQQQIFLINPDNGQYTTYAITYPSTTSSSNAYRFISALSFGKVMLYGGPGTAYGAAGFLYDPSTKKMTSINGDSNSVFTNDKKYGNGTTNFRWYFYNLVPIGNNINVVECIPFSTILTTGDDGVKYATYDVYMTLVDDNLNFIGNKYSG